MIKFRYLYFLIFIQLAFSIEVSNQNENNQNIKVIGSVFRDTESIPLEGANVLFTNQNRSQISFFKVFF